MSFLRSILIGSSVVIFFFAPCLVHAQSAKAAGGDSATFHSLDFKQGCWEVRVTTSISGLLTHMPDDFFKSAVPYAKPEDLAQTVAGLNAQVDQQNAQLKKPHVGQGLACNASQDFMMWNLGSSVPLPNSHCTDSLHSTVRELQRLIKCTGEGGATTEQKSEFTSADSEHFSGSIRLVTRSDAVREASYAWLGKWIGEAAPHMPHATPATDLEGIRPLGPRAVTALDPFRIVAKFEGQPWIAAIAIKMFGAVPAATAKEYGRRLDDVAQQIYLHVRVADEAVIANLAKKDPWKSQLGAAGIFVTDIHVARFNAWAYGGNPYDPIDRDGDQRNAEAARERILWDAYFSQASTPAEKQALMKKVREKYKMTVVDPDFYAGTVDW